MPLDLSDDDRKALAKDLAAELDTGQYGSRFVLSRRQLLSIAGGSAGVAGLTALGVDPATAQSAAGQVGTEASPEDVFAYNLDVQGTLQRDLDAGGQAIENAGSVSTGETQITDFPIGSRKDYVDYPDLGNSSESIQTTESVNTSPTTVFEAVDASLSHFLVIKGQDSNDSATAWIDLLLMTPFGGVPVLGSTSRGRAPTRSYTLDRYAVELALGSGSADVVAKATSLSIQF